MCRISGSVNRDRKYVQLMTDHQRKGGPDQYSLYDDGEITLGHNRLSILDLSDTGSQPMFTDRWVIVYSGEIYNHLELRNKIGPMHWKSHCDTLTLLMCIEHKGIEWTLENIEGMFSFAAYDKYDKKIYLAVDPTSIKPLHWFKDAKSFAFASSLGALTHLKDKWELDKFALIDMLALGATRTPLFSGMKRIPGGHLVTYDIEKEIVSTVRYHKPKEYKCTEHDLLEAVKESIRSTKIADVPVHMFLSGGIDSSVVASQCFGMPAVHLASPEYAFACQVATKYQNKVTLIEPAIHDAESALKDYAFQSGDCSAAAIVPYIVSKEVSKLGKVAISANGSDELFFGYNRMLPKTTKVQFDHIFRSGFEHSWGDYQDYQSTCELELNTYVQYDLNKTLDFASMCHGLEIRVPYLNKTVVEMALSVPRETHVNGYGNKSILKKFLISEGFDRAFVNRPKLGFSLYSEPVGYTALKIKGIKLLKEIGIDPTFTSQRDDRYFENAAAAFWAWNEVWRDKLY